MSSAATAAALEAQNEVLEGSMGLQHELSMSVWVARGSSTMLRARAESHAGSSTQEAARHDMQASAGGCIGAVNEVPGMLGSVPAGWREGHPAGRCEEQEFNLGQGAEWLQCTGGQDAAVDTGGWGGSDAAALPRDSTEASDIINEASVTSDRLRDDVVSALVAAGMHAGAGGREGPEAGTADAAQARLTPVATGRDGQDCTEAEGAARCTTAGAQVAAEARGGRKAPPAQPRPPPLCVEGRLYQQGHAAEPAAATSGAGKLMCGRERIMMQAHADTPRPLPSRVPSPVPSLVPSRVPSPVPSRVFSLAPAGTAHASAAPGQLWAPVHRFASSAISGAAKADVVGFLLKGCSAAQGLLAAACVCAQAPSAQPRDAFRLPHTSESHEDATHGASARQGGADGPLMRAAIHQATPSGPSVLASAIHQAAPSGPPVLPGCTHADCDGLEEGGFVQGCTAVVAACSEGQPHGRALSAWEEAGKGDVCSRASANTVTSPTTSSSGSDSPLHMHAAPAYASQGPSSRDETPRADSCAAPQTSAGAAPSVDAGRAASPSQDLCAACMCSGGPVATSGAQGSHMHVLPSPRQPDQATGLHASQGGSGDAVVVSTADAESGAESDVIDMTQHQSVLSLVPLQPLNLLQQDQPLAVTSFALQYPFSPRSFVLTDEEMRDAVNNVRAAEAATNASKAVHSSLAQVATGIRSGVHAGRQLVCHERLPQALRVGGWLGFRPLAGGKKTVRDGSDCSASRSSGSFLGALECSRASRGAKGEALRATGAAGKLSSEARAVAGAPEALQGLKQRPTRSQGRHDVPKACPGGNAGMHGTAPLRVLPWHHEVCCTVHDGDACV